MSTVQLPPRPSIEHLGHEARDLQRAVRAGDREALAVAGLEEVPPSYPLNAAQRATARRYGFPSWPRLGRHVEAIAARTWVRTDPAPEEPPADAFLRFACLSYDRDRPAHPTEALELLAERPELPTRSLAVAAVAGEMTEVRRQLAAAATPTGPYGWSPLLYLAYSRVPVAIDAMLEITRLLLGAGADPNDGRFFDGLPTPFTVLTGVFGGGENDQSQHPHAAELARLLLDAGADPNDAQALYNRMFRTDDDHLEVLFDAGLGTGDGGPWRRLRPDVLDPPAVLLETQLDWAVTHDQRPRVALLARHGVDVLRPLAGGRTPIQVALGNGHRALAGDLVALGADMPTLDPVEAFIAAALAGDADAVAGAPRAAVRAARSDRPGLVVWAAGQGNIAAVEALLAAGWDIDALGRGDVPLEQQWQTALHSAVERGDAALVRRLIELGADTTLRDSRFDGTAHDWAEHLDRPELAELLAR